MIGVASILAAVVPGPSALHSVSPSSGIAAGGTTLTLSGYRLGAAIDVLVDGDSVPFSVVDVSTISAGPTQDHDLGAVDITVVFGWGSIALPGAFTFTKSPLSFVSCTPNHGDSTGTTSVTLDVTGAHGVTSIEIEPYIVGVPFVVVDDETITLDLDGPSLGASGDDSVDFRIIRTISVDEVTGTAAFTFDHVAAAAVVSAISPIYGSTSGGTVVNITVDDSTGVTGAKVNGISLTSFSIIDGTTVQGTTGASSVGASDVVVTNAGGDSSPLVGAYVYCANDPTAWWEGSYGGAPWLPTASDGVSGGTIPVPRNLVTFGAHSAAGVGSAVDGKTPATFNGSTQAMTPTESTGQNLGASATAFTILVMMRTNATQAASGTWFHDPGVVMDSGGNGGLVLTNSGLVAGLDGPTVSTGALAQPSPGSWFMGAMRYDATHLDCRLNATDATQVAATAHSTFGSQLYTAVNYQETQFVHGDFLTIKMWDRRLSDAELAAEYALLKLKYPSASLP